MRKRRNGGFSLVEVMVAAGLLSLVLIATTTLFTSTCRLWRVGTSGTSANMYGSLAMRKLVTQIQEGQTAYAEGSHLFIQLPLYDATTGIYDRRFHGDLIEYYLSGDNGTETPTVGGDNTLWRRIGENKTRVAAHISDFQFDFQSSTLLQVKIWGWQSENASIHPELIQQRVSLRNQ